MCRKTRLQHQLRYAPRQALTHRKAKAADHNERLEFLGDRF
jgi:dsRNA-specific ribonuclease